MGNDRDRSRFTVHEGGDRPRPYHSRGGLNQIICRTCEEDTGVASSEFIESWLCPFEQGGRLRRKTGTRTLICVNCLTRGKVTRVF